MQSRLLWPSKAQIRLSLTSNKARAVHRPHPSPLHLPSPFPLFPHTAPISQETRAEDSEGAAALVAAGAVPALLALAAASPAAAQAAFKGLVALVGSHGQSAAAARAAGAVPRLLEQLTGDPRSQEACWRGALPFPPSPSYFIL